MNAKQQQELREATQLLAFYSQEIERYQEQWNLPPDRETHLNAWAAARRRLENSRRSWEPLREVGV